jgi:hypothetical protein
VRAEGEHLVHRGFSRASTPITVALRSEHMSEMCDMELYWGQGHMRRVAQCDVMIPSLGASRLVQDELARAGERGKVTGICDRNQATVCVFLRSSF